MHTHTSTYIHIHTYIYPTHTVHVLDMVHVRQTTWQSEPLCIYDCGACICLCVTILLLGFAYPSQIHVQSKNCELQKWQQIRKWQSDTQQTFRNTNVISNFPLVSHTQHTITKQTDKIAVVQLSTKLILTKFKINIKLTSRCDKSDQLMFVVLLIKTRLSNLSKLVQRRQVSKIVANIGDASSAHALV